MKILKFDNLVKLLLKDKQTFPNGKFTPGYGVKLRYGIKNYLKERTTSVELTKDISSVNYMNENAYKQLAVGVINKYVEQLKTRKQPGEITEIRNKDYLTVLEAITELEIINALNKTKYDGVIVPKNRIISFVMWYYYKTEYFNQKEQQSKFVFTLENRIESITVHKAVNCWTAMRNHSMRILNNVVKVGQSEVIFCCIDEVKIIKDTAHNIGDISNRQALGYKLVGVENPEAVEKYFRNNGRCVVDYLHFEMCQSDFHKKYHNVFVIEDWFNHMYPGCLEKGITLKQTLVFVKMLKNVSFHPFNLLGQKVKEYEYIALDKSAISLTFLINNNHIYPLCGYLKQKAAKCNDKLLDKVDFTVDYAEYSYCDDSNNELLINGLFSTKPVVVVEADDFKELASIIIMRTKKMITSMKFNQSKIEAFVHPVSLQIYVTGKDFEARSNTLEQMKIELKSDEVVFKNQSWAEISNKYFELKFGTIPSSTYSNELIDSFTHSMAKPYIAQTYNWREYTYSAKKVEDEDIKSVDIRRCYTSVMIDNDVDYPLYNLLDGIKKYDGVLENGRYYLEDDVWICNLHIRLNRGWYPYNLVKYLVDNDYTTTDNISLKIKASGLLDKSTFKSFASEVTDKYQSAKWLNNTFVGGMGRSKFKTSVGGFTNSREMALAIKTSEVEANKNVKVYSLGELYFIRSSTEDKLISGNVPIYEHIVAGGIIKLIDMYSKVVGKKSKVFCLNVDSIKLTNPVMAAIDCSTTEKRIGGYYLEEGKHLRGRFVECLDSEAFQYTTPFWSKEAENREFLGKNSCLVTGGGGVGKTEMLKNLYMECDEKCLILTPTNANCENLQNRNVPAITFDAFIECKGDIKKYGRILVDEFSMINKAHLKMLHIAKRGGAIINLFGDVSQCKPVENNWYRYDLNNFIKYICDYNYMECAYKKGFARYDDEYHTEIEYFKKNRKLLMKRKIDDVLKSNIVTTNKRRMLINNEAFEKYKTKVYKFGGMNVFNGCRIICVNNKFKSFRLINSKRFTVLGLEGDKLKVLSISTNEEHLLEDYQMNCFELGFAFTIYKIQGTKIDEPYNIYIGGMSANELYTALSRGTSASNVFYNYHCGMFDWDVPEHKVEKFIITAADINEKAYIYRIDFDNDAVYIGSTVQSVEERFQQHKDAPTNKVMSDLLMKNNGKISIVTTLYNISKCELEKYEYKAINDFFEEGVNVVNIRGVEKKTEKKSIVAKEKNLDEVVSVLENSNHYCIRYTFNGKRELVRVKKTTDTHSDMRLLEAKKKKVLEMFI